MPVVPMVTPDGARIREKREELGLSKAGLAALMPRHRHWKTIERIELGRDKRISREYLDELAAALGVEDTRELTRQDVAA